MYQAPSEIEPSFCPCVHANGEPSTRSRLSLGSGSLVPQPDVQPGLDRNPYCIQYAKGCRAQGKHISDTLVAHPSPQRMFDAFVRRDGFAETSSWLSIRFREGDALPPRKQTHGDTITRVKWRSKEALDYVQTLQRCAQEHPDIPYYAVIQDDVVFTDRIRDLRDWVENKKRTQVCTLSLFDFDQKQDNGILIRANMVARLWKKRMIDPFTQYVIRRYDDSPIDWLHDDFCRPLNLRTMVMVPNPVRHLGEISTLINKLSPTN